MTSVANSSEFKSTLEYHAADVDIASSLTEQDAERKINCPTDDCGVPINESDSVPMEITLVSYDDETIRHTAVQALEPKDEENLTNAAIPASEPHIDEDVTEEDICTSKDSNVVEESHTGPLYDGSPRLLTCISSPFSAANFTKGCKWSPDGTCLLVCSEDTRLRLFNLPQSLYTAAEAPEPTEPPEPVVQSHEGELIYDYTWYPLMRSDTPASCCYASSSRGHPIHLFDAFDGGLRCTYRSYNSVDEVTAAYSVAFSVDGSQLYAGLNGALAVFDVSRPGRQLETRRLSDRKSAVTQPGIVSCIGMCASCPELYAVGTYLRSVGLYSAEQGSPLCLLQGQTGGVTHLQFSPDGNRLYSGGRKDPEILCWDLRNLGHILYSLERHVVTNQRVYFDCDVSGRFVFSGDSDGCVQVWDTMTPASACGEALTLPSLRRFSNNRSGCVNGVSAHPWLPVLATSCGERHLSDDADEVSVLPDSNVQLWWLQS